MLSDNKRKEIDKNMNSYMQCINDGLDEFMEKVQKDSERMKKHQPENEDHFLRNIFVICVIFFILTFSPAVFLMWVIAYLLTSKS